MPFVAEDADHSGDSATSVLPYQPMFRCNGSMCRTVGKVVGCCTGVMSHGLII